MEIGTEPCGLPRQFGACHLGSLLPACCRRGLASSFTTSGSFLSWRSHVLSTPFRRWRGCSFSSHGCYFQTVTSQSDCYSGGVRSAWREQLSQFFRFHSYRSGRSSP